MKKLFPSRKAVRRHREVVIFSAGLMRNPRPLVQFMYKMQVEGYGGFFSSIDVDLFKSIYHESMVRLSDHPMHNEFLNFYDHYEDVDKQRPHDTTQVNFPSRLYRFKQMKEAVVLENYLSAAAQTPNCTIYIEEPDEAVTRDLLLTCSQISNHEAVTHLHMVFVRCPHSSLQSPRMINPQLLVLSNCSLAEDYVKCLLQQLIGSGDSLQELWLWRMDLSPFEPLLDELLEDVVAHHGAQKGQRKLKLKLKLWLIYGTNLSKVFEEKWRNRCRGVESIECWIHDYNNDDNDDGTE